MYIGMVQSGMWWDTRIPLHIPEYHPGMRRFDNLKADELLMKTNMRDITLLKNVFLTVVWIPISFTGWCSSFYTRAQIVLWRRIAITRRPIVFSSWRVLSSVTVTLVVQPCVTLSWSSRFSYCFWVVAMFVSHVWSGTLDIMLRPLFCILIYFNIISRYISDSLHSLPWLLLNWANFPLTNWTNVIIFCRNLRSVWRMWSCLFGIFFSQRACKATAHFSLMWRCKIHQSKKSIKKGQLHKRETFWLFVVVLV